MNKNIPFQFSAGGIVVKKTKNKNPEILKRVQDDIYILVCQHSQHHGWVFPKGLIDKEKKETKQEAAIREVKEETGAEGNIISDFPEVSYWYVFEGVKIKKTVYYFLMEYIKGDITKHDMEMENVEWVPIEKVEKRLTYPSDKKIWKEAKKMIESFSLSS